MTDFYDQLKSSSAGFASMHYELLDWREGNLVKLEIDIATTPVDAFAQIVHKDKAQPVARRITQRLKELIPRQLFDVRIQARVGGKILASENISPLRKDVTAKLYGGDRTRKDKLLKKQAAGKKKMKQIGRVEIPNDLFLKFYKDN
jgi:GTP-binding protein LepA